MLASTSHVKPRNKILKTRKEGQKKKEKKKRKIVNRNSHARSFSFPRLLAMNGPMTLQVTERNKTRNFLPSEHQSMKKRKSEMRNTKVRKRIHLEVENMVFICFLMVS